mgnify:CR=1 FL=1|tara:strand:- start:651 stop:827 length:177 start_codon:yes stop_codon:yes gene_type:complete
MNEKIVDFTVIKLKKMHKEFLQEGNLSIAEDIKNLLEEYQKGNAKVVWKKGMPYVKFK